MDAASNGPRGGGGEAEPSRLNERIARALAQAIASDEYPVGTSLPPEAVLCSTYGASRFTVREALRKLAELGLIERRQGAGSKVVSRTARAAYEHVFKDLQDFFEYARDTHFEIASADLVALDDADGRYVKAPAGSRWLRIAGVRLTASRNEKLSYINVFVHSRFVPVLDDLRTLRGAIYAAIEARSGETVAEAIQDISAVPMPVAAAKALGQPRGTTAMKFVRRYCDASGGTMLTSVNWHPAERFTYTMQIKRGTWQA